jgi:hypothetical protein
MKVEICGRMLNHFRMKFQRQFEMVAGSIVGRKVARFESICAC